MVKTILLRQGYGGQAKENKKMKKLIIAAAMVCATAFAQAATVNWSISGVKAEGNTSPTAGWSVMAFYTEVGAGSSAIEAAINSKTASSLAFETTTLSVSMSKGKVASHDADATGITDTSKNYDIYFVVFNNADATAATKYAMQSVADLAYSGMDGKYTALSTFSSSTPWVEISAPVIPEPTTGLLVLLGVAGLALRRRA